MVSDSDEVMTIFVNNGLGLVELKVLALWQDIALVEGWNSYTPYVVCWGLSEKHGNHSWDGGKYYSNMFDGLAEWKERAERWGM
jgi:hypothetical protein